MGNLAIGYVTIGRTRVLEADLPRLGSRFSWRNFPADAEPTVAPFHFVAVKTTVGIEHLGI